MLVLQFLAVRHTTERAGRTRAVIVRDADSDARGQPREHRQLCPNALVSGLVGHGHAMRNHVLLSTSITKHRLGQIHPRQAVCPEFLSRTVGIYPLADDLRADAMAASSGNRTRSLPLMSSGDQPQPSFFCAARTRRCNSVRSTGPSSIVSGSTAGRTRSR